MSALQIIPPVPPTKHAVLQGERGFSGDGGNRTRATIPPSDGLRNCVLMHPTDQLTRRVSLPLVRLPHEWHEDTFQHRPARAPGNKGKTFPATPVYGTDADLILNALYNPAVHSVGKWAGKWGPIRHRNRTIMAVARGTGVRIHELLLLRPDDVDFDTNQLIVRRGKGGKRRLIAILPAALEELDVWMSVRTDLGFDRGDLIFPVLEGPTRGGPVSQGYMRKKLHEAARDAGVTVRPVPHQWRHGLAVELHRRKVPIGIIQRQLGHSSPATTGIYLAGISADEVIESVLGAFE